MAKTPLIIIGTGLAGYHLAKEMRRLNPTVSLVLITQDDGHFYSKPQLSTAISATKTPENLVITPVETMRAQLNATIFTFSNVTAINRQAKTVSFTTPDGEETLAYEQLVFALGAAPKPFPLFENIAQHFRVNNLQDYAAFIQALSKRSHLAIMGSGLVGCEFAYDLAKNHDVSVISPDVPLAGLVPKAIGLALQAHLGTLNIQWHIPTMVTAIEQNDKLALTLANGQHLNVDLVLSAIGLNPQIQLAQNAGLTTRQGIVINEYLQTNCPDIFALGDCAEIAGVCRQYVAPILQSARALASTLNGQPTAVNFPLMPISLKVASYPVIVLPPITPEGEWHIESFEDGIIASFRNVDGHLKGYALSGSQVVHRQDYLKQINALAPSALQIS